jgi:hypothetical protein
MISEDLKKMLEISLEYLCGNSKKSFKNYFLIEMIIMHSTGSYLCLKQSRIKERSKFENRSKELENLKRNPKRGTLEED